jgi:exonuclease III
MTDRVSTALTSAVDVDVFVLSEYRVPKAGDRITATLSSAGWAHSLHATIPTGLKGVAIFARHPLEPARDLIRAWGPRGLDLTQWIVAARIPTFDLAVCGTYVPYADGPLKSATWNALIGCARRNQRERVLIAGDFNSCFSTDSDTSTGYTVDPLRRMCAVSVDTWRAATPIPSHRDVITWTGPNGKGNRLDFAFATPGLAPHVKSVFHRHDVRTDRVSDHSAIIVDLDLSTNSARG